jgi:hypothetical protein
VATALFIEVAITLNQTDNLDRDKIEHHHVRDAPIDSNLHLARID